MLFIYGLSLGETLFIIAAAAVISFIAGLWAGKRLFGRKRQR